MTPLARTVAISALAMAVGAVLVAKTATSASGGGDVESAQAAARPLPRLVDLGAGKCIPCKAMAPILAELKAEYAGRMEVQFIDVWESPGAAEPYAIHMIPTQIFFSADGRELARHEGFMAKGEILAQWHAVGVTF